MVDKKVVLVDDLDSSVGIVDSLYSYSRMQPKDSVGKVGITDLTKHLPKDIILETGIVTVDGDGRARVSDISKVTGKKTPILDIRYSEAKDFFDYSGMQNNLPPPPTNGARLFFHLRSNYVRRLGELTLIFRSFTPTEAYWVAVDYTSYAVSKYTYPTDGFEIRTTSSDVILDITKPEVMPSYTDMNTYNTTSSLLCIDIPDPMATTGLPVNDVLYMFTTTSAVPGMEGIEVRLDYKFMPTVWRNGSIEQNIDYDLLSSSGSASTFTVNVAKGYLA